LTTKPSLPPVNLTQDSVPVSVKRAESVNSGTSLNTSLMSTYPIYTCHLVYLGCRDCELLYGSSAVERSISGLLNNQGNNFKNSSLVELKIQRSGITLTDEARKLFFRKHFNKKQLRSCHADPLGRTVNVSAYSGLPKGALLFGVVLKAAGQNMNQCHILAEVDQSVSTGLIVDKIQLFVKNQLV